MTGQLKNEVQEILIIAAENLILFMRPIIKNFRLYITMFHELRLKTILKIVKRASKSERFLSPQLEKRSVLKESWCSWKSI